jgi:2-phosphosulfolactate phosphatase
LIPDFDLENKVVVVVDIFRATTCMITALAHDVAAILPVATLKEAAALHDAGYITCAEREGRKADGFDMGNSPFGFMSGDLRGRTIAMTTTNGTKSIVLSRHAQQVIVGGFVNISAVARYLQVKGRDAVVVCAGWKDKVNAEDTLFAGALADKLEGIFEPANDATQLARASFLHTRHNLKHFLSKTSHFQRLLSYGLERDIDFCLLEDEYRCVPILNNEGLLVTR